MNPRQAAFYRQAVSDFAVFGYLSPAPAGVWNGFRRSWCRVVGVRTISFPVCHELHYLQMCTEKLAKAYYLTDTGTGHRAFRRFITDILGNLNASRSLGFATLADLTRWQGSVVRVVDAVEDLAPSIADRLGLPNPEYPWPRTNPTIAPVDHLFTTEVYNHIDAQAKSGEAPFLTILARMVATMRPAGWHL